jgi:rhodanese-related sulfurtransferase
LPYKNKTLIKRFFTLRSLAYGLFIIGSIVAVANGSVHGAEAGLLLTVAGIACIGLVTKTCIGGTSCQLNEMNKQVIIDQKKQMKQLIKITIVAIFMALSACNTSQPPTKSAAFKGNGKHILVDVRSTEEWNEDGHADCAVNYPLDELEQHKAELSQYDSVTFVCKSGGRAGQATDWLSGLQLGNVVQNGGSWESLSCK